VWSKAPAQLRKWIDYQKRQILPHGWNYFGSRPENF
jgi:hypothetical protein